MPDTAGESLGSARPGLPEQRNDRRRRLILAACLIATFMAAVESTIVATIIPTIVSDLGGFDLFSLGVHSLPADPGGYDPDNIDFLRSRAA